MVYQRTQTIVLRNQHLAVDVVVKMSSQMFQAAWSDAHFLVAWVDFIQAGHAFVLDAVEEKSSFQ